MKFVLVNHEPPGEGAVCSTCSQPLGSSYIRHVHTQRRYCDHDCYSRYRPANVMMPWSAAAYSSSIEMIMMLTAISSWSLILRMEVVSRSLVQAILRARDFTTEGGDH